VAGRTDAGVHATAQVVSLDLADDAPGAEPYRLVRSLNGLLPRDVAVRGALLQPDGFDARADALSRVYDYRLLVGPPSPLRRHRTLRHQGAPLDRPALDACAAACVGQHDFTAFTPTDTKHVFFARTVLDCHWREEGDEVVLRIEANAFLRHMVRVLVGTMLEVGRGRRTVDDFTALLDGAPRSAAGRTAPAQALTLVAVRYPPATA
jgi:tRNA pseudouridine38-40 synthase